MSGTVLTDGLRQSAPADLPQAGRVRRRAGVVGLGAVVPLLLLGLWAALTRGEATSARVPGPERVLDALVRFFAGEQSAPLSGVVPFTGAGLEHIGASLSRWGVSFTAAVLVGTALGLLLALSPLASRLLDPLFNALRAVPLYAWLPLALVWFGIGEGAARALIFVGALWPVLVATADGVRRVPRAHVEAARMLGTPRARLWRRVHLPAALPELVTGLRLSLTLAWACVIVGELTGTDRGVGAMMNASREAGRIDQIVVGLLVFAVIGYLADLVLRAVARPFVRWSLG